MRGSNKHIVLSKWVASYEYYKHIKGDRYQVVITTRKYEVLIVKYQVPTWGDNVLGNIGGMRLGAFNNWQQWVKLHQSKLKYCGGMLTTSPEVGTLINPGEAGWFISLARENEFASKLARPSRMGRVKLACGDSQPTGQLLTLWVWSGWTTSGGAIK